MTNNLIVVDDVREAMRLWLPTGVAESSVSPDEFGQKLIAGQQAVSDFLETRITPVEFVEIIDDCEVDIDDYLDTLAFNLRW